MHLRGLTFYEENSYVASYTYGAGLNRTSQKVEHYPNKAEAGNERRNAYTNLAVEQYDKLYFHQDRLGSTIRITKENRETIVWADFDAWGPPRTSKDFNMNMAGVDNAIGFTSYTYTGIIIVFTKICTSI